MFKNCNYILVSLLTISLVGCAANPVTGRNELNLVSESKEIEIGDTNYLPLQQISGGPYTAHPEIEEYVKSVGKRISSVADRASLPYEFEVVNDSQINAWALPGGKIAVHRGLLSKLSSEAALAAVLGHEVTHAAARHTAKQYQRMTMLRAGILAADIALWDDDRSSMILTGALLGSYLVNLSYSRSDESEADHYGMVYMARAGYDPIGAIEVQELFLSLQENKSNLATTLLSSHPTSEKRLAANRVIAETLHVENPVHGVQEYQSVMRPLVLAEPAYKSYDKAIKAYEEESYIKAHQLLDEAIKIESKEALFWQLKALTFLAQEMPAEALICANSAIDLNAGYYMLFMSRGQIYESLEEFESAMADYESSLALLETTEAQHAIKQLKKKIKKAAKKR